MIDLTKPMFPAAVQLAVINANQEHIDFMKTSTDIHKWNRNRHVVRDSMLGDSTEYIMLMGHIDTTVFGETFNLKGHGRT